MSDFLISVPRGVLLHLVRAANRKEGYGDTEVRVSLLLDVDMGRVQSQRDYARIWGRSRKWVRYHWDDIWQDVARWCTSHGRQLDGPLAQRLPEEWLAWAHEHAAGDEAEEGPKVGPKKGPRRAQKSGDTAGNGQSGAQEGPTKGPHTNHPSSPSPKNGSLARAREGEVPLPGVPDPLPEWFDRAVWEEWEQYRREKRNANTPTGRSRQIARLQRFYDAGHDPSEIIRTSIANGWTGLFEPDERRRPSARPGRRVSGGDGVDLADNFGRLLAATGAAAGDEPGLE